MHRSTCKDCGEPVMLAKLKDGSRIALDPVAPVYYETHRNSAGNSVMAPNANAWVGHESVCRVNQRLPHRRVETSFTFPTAAGPPPGKVRVGLPDGSEVDIPEGKYSLDQVLAVVEKAQRGE